MILPSQLEPHHVLYIIGIAAVLIAPEALRMIFSRDNAADRDRNRRMKGLRRERPQDQVQTLLQPHKRQGWLHRMPLAGGLPQRMKQAGMVIKPERFILICGSAGLAVFFLATLVFGAKFGLPLGFGIGGLLPLMAVNIARKRRIDAFTRQLPDALELMMRGLRVGHPISATIANVGSAMADPIGLEFRMMADQISYGDNLTSAFRAMADRMDQEDMHYLAVSVSIQHGTGGNLATMLGVLSKVIRERIMMRRRVKAISSEGRISAMVLSALPVVIYIGTTITAPNYYAGVRDDPIFMPIAVTIVLLVIANFLALRKLSTFRF